MENTLVPFFCQELAEMSKPTFISIKLPITLAQRETAKWWLFVLSIQVTTPSQEIAPSPVHDHRSLPLHSVFFTHCWLTSWVGLGGRSLLQFPLLTSMLSLCLYPWETHTHLWLLASVSGREVSSHVAEMFSKVDKWIFTFRYVSPLISYSNLQSVLCRMFIVGSLTWIRRAGGYYKINQLASPFFFIFYPGLAVFNLSK